MSMFDVYVKDVKRVERVELVEPFEIILSNGSHPFKTFEKRVSQSHTPIFLL